MTAAELIALNNRAAAGAPDLPWREREAELAWHAAATDSKPRCFAGKNPGMWSTKWNAKYKSRRKPPAGSKRSDIPRLRRWSMGEFFDSRSRSGMGAFAKYVTLVDGIPLEFTRSAGRPEHPDSHKPSNWRALLVARYLAAVSAGAGTDWRALHMKTPKPKPFDRQPDPFGRVRQPSAIVDTLTPLWKRKDARGRYIMFAWCRKRARQQSTSGRRWESVYIAKPGKWMFDDLRGSDSELVKARIPRRHGDTIMGTVTGRLRVRWIGPDKLKHKAWAHIGYFGWATLQAGIEREMSKNVLVAARIYREGEQDVTQEIAYRHFDSYFETLRSLEARDSKVVRMKKAGATDEEIGLAIDVTDRQVRRIWKIIRDRAVKPLIGEQT